MDVLNIVADENILLLDEFFGALGNITRVNGRSITAAQVADADALVLRSTTQVNADLLRNSSVSFVGTCTIGIDHLDTKYLDAAHIAWHNAPGCNAEGVGDYVVSAINHAWQIHGIDPRDGVIGIVGAGNVGGRLIKRLRNAGLNVIVSDPPREQAKMPEDADLTYVSLEQLAQQATIVCLHAPLTISGDHASKDMINKHIIDLLSPNSVLISAGRGEVIDQQALQNRLEQYHDIYCYLDVWHNEPHVDPSIAISCQLVTPHIAGHSLEGKVRGTEMIYQALCHHYQLPITQRLSDLMPTVSVSDLSFDTGASLSSMLNAACNLVYPLAQDDARCRSALGLQNGVAEYNMGAAFDLLRKNYPVRREFSTLRLHGIGQDENRQFMRAMGFQVF